MIHFGLSSTRPYPAQISILQPSFRSESLIVKTRDAVKFAHTAEERAAIETYRQYDEYIRNFNAVHQNTPSNQMHGKRGIQNLALSYMDQLQPPINPAQRNIIKSFLTRHSLFKSRNFENQANFLTNLADFMYYVTIFSAPNYANHNQNEMDAALTEWHSKVERGRSLAQNN
jgi:hypothetical protein